MESEQKVSPAGSHTRSSFWKLWAPPCLLAGLIFIFSSAPGHYYPEHPDFVNSIVHFSQFGLLSFFLARALHLGHQLSGRGLFLLAAAVCVIFGLFDEVHQFLVPERMFGLMDLMYDTAGSASGSGLYLFLSGREGNVPGPEYSDR